MPVYHTRVTVMPNVSVPVRALLVVNAAPVSKVRVSPVPKSMPVSRIRVINTPIVNATARTNTSVYVNADTKWDYPVSVKKSMHVKLSRIRVINTPHVLPPVHLPIYVHVNKAGK
jgi:hypothetical protein